MSGRRRWALWLINGVVSALVLVGAMLIARTLMANRTQPRRAAAEAQGVLVEVIEAERAEHRLDVRGRGEVVAAHRLILQPEVSGRVVTVHPELLVGRVVEAGEVLIEIDPRDYQLAVRERRAAVADARAALAIEAGQQAIARREWEAFRARDGRGGDETPPALALREPQEQRAEAAVDMARVRLDQAQLALKRTELTAPFTALVQGENVEPGQLVTAQSQVAALIDARVFWVQVSLPMSDLGRLAVPGIGGAAPGQGSMVTITQDLGDGQQVEREGQVIGLLGELDPLGRMARVIVEVPDPLGLAPDSPHHGQPLLLGAYVEAQLTGADAEQLVALPEQALHDGRTVYLVGDDEKLTLREVEVVSRTPAGPLVRGLTGGERVVISALGTPIEGMQLRVKPAPDATSGDDSAPDATSGDDSAPDATSGDDSARDATNGDDDSANGGASDRAAGQEGER